jgi:thiamine-monophosphate kinase
VFENETEFVRWLQRLTLRREGRSAARPYKTPGHLKLGIGDDAALVEVARGQELILTTDMTIEDVHFRRRLHPPRAVGHRALARALSDIAAMGGIPRFVLVSLAITRGTERSWVEELYAGMFSLARRFGVTTIGGDTAVIPGKTFLDVIVAGEVPRGRALRRSGARPGDQIFVSGRLGLSAWGLRLLPTAGRLAHSPTGTLSRLRRDRWRAPATRTREEAIQAHLYPEPQCALGRFLSQRRLASALMDVSDGLSTDLARLCEASGVGACLWVNRIPGPGAFDAAESLTLALHGGEDYQLLFTVPPHKAPRIPSTFRGLPLHRIGEIQKAKGLRLVGWDGKVRRLEPAGWDHFRKSQ